ncbi:MAG: phosphoserine phosphatase SerB [Sphingomonadaceae bacterium]
MSEPVILTLAAAHGLSADDIALAQDAVTRAGGIVTAETAFDPPYATDLILRGITSAVAREAVEAVATGFDCIAQTAGPDRVKRLLVADMDSTMIGQECIDELADFAGKKPEIAAITEAAMRGELDFGAALDARVAALAGLADTAITRCLDERIVLTSGARTLVQTMRAHGARTVLISGGFTRFTGPIAERIGFDHQVANRLLVANGALTGTVEKPIVDSSVKRATLIAEREQLSLPHSATLAVGDGANDIPMLEEAGLGIAYHAKPKAAAAADAAVRVGDLTILLWAQGIARRDWRTE